MTIKGDSRWKTGKIYIEHRNEAGERWHGRHSVIKGEESFEFKEGGGG